MHIIAAKAVAFKEALSPEFKEYQIQVVKNAQAMANRLMERGLKLVSGGTDNHLMLVNLVGTGVTGKQLETWLDEAHITVNKNSVPNEPLSPFVTSGVRVGTPAVTTRGMKEAQMVQIADMIADIVENGESAIEGVKTRLSRFATSILSTRTPYCCKKRGKRRNNFISCKRNGFKNVSLRFFIAIRSVFLGVLIAFRGVFRVRWRNIVFLLPFCDVGAL